MIADNNRQVLALSSNEKNAGEGSFFLTQLLRALKAVLHRDTRMPLLALAFASCVGVGLVVTRTVVAYNLNYRFLIWNLILAWVPLVFALLACEKFRAGEARQWSFAALSGAWLLFFPNAPYILTDFIHLFYGTHRVFWVDLVLILIFAFTGLLLGFLSLYLMQSLVRRSFGSFASWLFIAAVAGLSGFGIYLGRFLRLNSWDIVAKPIKLYRDVSGWVADPLASTHTSVFPLMFAILFLSYLILYAFTHLPRPQQFEATKSTTPREV